PTGRMSVIPFETLLTKPAKDFNLPYNTFPYLIRKYAIRYEFSAGLMLQKKNTGTSSIASALLCAPVDFPSRDNLDALPGTEQEVNTIQNLFSSKNISTEVLLHGKAN